MRLDLHLHTSCSDGLFSPADLVTAAARASLDVIALTDHDTVSGVAPALAAAAALGRELRVVPGIELSCTLGGADLHLLGYAVDPAHERLLGLAGSIAERRRGRVADICGRLRALGVAISVDDVVVLPGNAAIGRLHVAQALVRLGRVGGVQEAFNLWLRDGGPAAVPGCGPDVREGIEVILAAGGCPVWAHPSSADARQFAALAACGLAGVETLRPNVAPADSAALELSARKAGLVVTGGSDWHGADRPALGSWYVTERHIGAFLSRIGVAA